MSKMDRQGVRTPADIERKYNVGQIGDIKVSVGDVKKSVNDINKTIKTIVDTLTDLKLWAENVTDEFGRHTVKFLNKDGSTYATYLVIKGLKIEAPPSSTPTSEGEVFSHWVDEAGDVATFPVEVNSNMEFKPVFIESYATKLRNHFGISKTECPYVVIMGMSLGSGFYIRLFFCETLSSITEIRPKYHTSLDSGGLVDFSFVLGDTANHIHYNAIVDAIINKYEKERCKTYTDAEPVEVASNAYWWSNKSGWSPSCKGVYTFE